MELSEMKSIWQAYDNKLERSLKLNLRCLEMIQAQKVRSKLRPMLWIRIFEIVLHGIVILWLAGFLIKYFFEIKFAVAAVLLIIFFAMAFINSTRQLILLMQIDYTEDILSIQKKLTLLRSHILDYINLTFICIPTYLAWPIIAFKVLGNIDISKVNPTWWLWNLVFTILITPVCIWLYREISYKNIHKKWVRFIIEKSVGTRVSEAMKFVKEIDELKKEHI